MKELLLLSILAFSFFAPNAQVIPQNILDRINHSDYIFEGKVIRSDPYKTDDKMKIYTSSTIEIYKIFKGNLECGTIEVITRGGCVGDSCEKISHNLVLKKGMIGVFLCNETTKELPRTDFYPEDNVLKLDFPYDIQGYIKYFLDNFNFQIVDYTFQLDSLARIYDLLDLATQIH